MDNQRNLNQDQLSLPGPSNINQNNSSSDDDDDHLEGRLSKLTIKRKQQIGNKDHPKCSKETCNTKKIDGCYVNLETDYDENDIDDCITEWQCVYCLFINTRLTNFCNMCCKVPVDNVNPELARALRLSNDEIVDRNYDYIVDYCHSMKKGYIDDQFIPNSTSLYYKIINTPTIQANKIKWRRIRDTTPDDEEQSLHWVMYREPKSTDVIQNQLDDCWLLAALAALASRRNVLYEILGQSIYSHEGVYKIRLFKNGKWTTVLIDDYFPCDKDGRLIYAKGPNKQLWPALLEKAVAKLFGCYESLVSGWPVEGFVLLTGQPCETIFIHNEYFESDVSEVDFDMIWQTILSAKDSGYVMATTCNNLNLSEDVYQSVGLHKNHAYAVMDVRQVKDDRVIKLYDPQTLDSWKGDYSLQSYKWLCEYKINICPNYPGDAFWLPYPEYVKYFSSVDICKIGDWCFTSVDGLLLPFVHASSLSGYLITIPSEPTEVHLTLFQNNQRYKEADNRRLMDLSIVVFKKNGTIIDNLVQYSGRHIHSFASCSSTLDPGEYFVVPLAFNHFYGHFHFYPRFLLYPESKLLIIITFIITFLFIFRFVLNIHSTTGLSIDNFETSDYLLSDIMIKVILKYGTKYDLNENLNLRVFTKNWSGGILLIENRSDDKWSKFICNCGDSNNLIATRNSLQTNDVIPPLTYQIINILTRIKFAENFRLKLNYEYHYVSDRVDPTKIPHRPKIDCRIIGLHSPRPLKL